MHKLLLHVFTGTKSKYMHFLLRLTRFAALHSSRQSPDGSFLRYNNLIVMTFFARIYYRKLFGDSPCGLLVSLRSTRRVSRQMAPSFDHKRKKLISKHICLSAFFFYDRAAWLVVNENGDPWAT